MTASGGITRLATAGALSEATNRRQWRMRAWRLRTTLDSLCHWGGYSDQLLWWSERECDESLSWIEAWVPGGVLAPNCQRQPDRAESLSS